MPKYEVTAPDGRTFELEGDAPPNEQELEQVFSSMGAGAKPETAQAPTSSVPEWGRKNPTLYGIAGAARETLGPVVEALGMAGGAAAGTVAGTAASAPTAFTGALPLATAGAAAGAGLGYAGARQFTGAVDEWLGNRPTASIGDAARKAVNDTATGAMMEAGGQAAVPVIGKAVQAVGKGIKQTLGATTGAGPGAIEEATKGGEAFTSAMRGKTSGEEIVDNVRGALQSLKDQRATAYQEKLGQLANEKSLDITPIRMRLESLMQKYNVRMDKEGNLDFSRIAMGKSGRKDIEEIIDTVKDWGKQKGDRTPLGLDTLKRQLDDFYSDSSQARQFVTALKKEVWGTISKNVPEYAEMTKGYSEATKLIKDIETGLMLRKNGMTGRVTGDMTLRRLMQAMRENQELKKDLLNILGSKAGEDLSGQVAGYAMSDMVPRGLVGKLSAGSVGFLGYLDPKFYPLLATSSPRIVGEFLNAYGKAAKAAGMTLKGTGTALREGAEYAAASRVKSEPLPAISTPEPDEKKPSGFRWDSALMKLIPLIPSEAEAATGLDPYVARNRAIAEAAGDYGNAVDIPQASTAQASRPQLSSAQASAAADRMIADMERNKQLQAAPKARPHIPVKQVIVKTIDGEALMYKDTKGRLYESDPNE